MEWSKEVFSKNLQYYLNQSGMSQKELAETIGVSTATMNEWIKAKKFPRIDKIERMANHFGILKSDLIEDKPIEYKESQKSNREIAQIVMRMRTDNDFLELCKKINKLDEAQIESVVNMLSAFIKE